MSTKRAKALMVMGTGSGVGKSFITAGLCRILSDAGVRVAPFKAQNMSNNSFVTQDGGEMGRAQVVQAECARTEPSVHMNPILLKPCADNGSQVVVHGKALGTMDAKTYYGRQNEMWRKIEESYAKLASEYEMLVIEGAGSPAEINLKDSDIVNCKVAELAGAPCLLVGDIDKGGVFAWLVGTLALLEESERSRITGLIINKFRGDFTLLEPGLRMLEDLSGKKVLGVLPYDLDLMIEEEDSLALEKWKNETGPHSLDIAVIHLPRISNATDFQILAEEPGVSVRMVRRVSEVGTPDLLILPGTKSTTEDLHYLKTQGLAARIKEYAGQGGRVMGICGGLQMLGEEIGDEEGVESRQRLEKGLSLLSLKTRFFGEKILKRVQGKIKMQIFSCPVEAEFSGYEIHRGQTVRGKEELFMIADASTRVLGTYVHGIFDDSSFRRAFLEALRKSVDKRIGEGTREIPSMKILKEKNYDRLAQLLRENLNLHFLEPCLNLSSPSY